MTSPVVESRVIVRPRSDGSVNVLAAVCAVDGFADGTGPGLAAGDAAGNFEIKFARELPRLDGAGASVVRLNPIGSDASDNLAVITVPVSALFGTTCAEAIETAIAASQLTNPIADARGGEGLRESITLYYVKNHRNLQSIKDLDST